MNPDFLRKAIFLDLVAGYPIWSFEEQALLRDMAASYRNGTPQLWGLNNRPRITKVREMFARVQNASV